MTFQVIIGPLEEYEIVPIQAKQTDIQCPARKSEPKTFQCVVNSTADFFFKISTS